MGSTNEDKITGSILNAISKLRAQLAELTKTTNDKIAGLEIAYEALTGEKVPTEVATPAKRTRRGTRRGIKIDRQGAAKTYQFLLERGPDKPTTVKMVARKFNISPEAAQQRLLKLIREGTAVRASKGEYVPAVTPE